MMPTPTHLKLGWLSITKAFVHVLLHVQFYIRVNTQYNAWESGATFISHAVLRYITYSYVHTISQPEKLFLAILLVSNARWASGITEYVPVDFF